MLCKVATDVPTEDLLLKARLRKALIWGGSFEDCLGPKLLSFGGPWFQNYKIGHSCFNFAAVLADLLRFLAACRRLLTSWCRLEIPGS